MIDLNISTVMITKLLLYFIKIGLLIEPNKNTFKKLLNKNRNAIHLNSCLSSDKKPQNVSFLSPDMDQLGGVVGNNIPVYSLQLWVILRVANHTKCSLVLTIGIGLIRDGIKGTVSEEICLPLYSILLSIGNPVVDYFSLDVEGAEIGVLKSIPFDKVDIKV